MTSFDPTLCFRRPSLLLIVTAIAWALATFAPNRCAATSVIKLSDDQLVRMSSTVIEGRVVNVRSEWNARHNQIHTIVTINVSDTFKGQAPANRALTLRVLGGKVDDTVMELVDGPSFETGEDVILFLEGDGSSLQPIVGLFQGKLNVVTDPATGLRMVSGREVTRDQFVQEMRTLISAEEEVR